MRVVAPRRRQTVRLIVTEIPAEATHELRRRVLRDGLADAVVTFPEDDRPGAMHLGVRAGRDIVGIASFMPSPTPHRPGVETFQLRGMAVATERQGQGLGRLLLEAGVERLTARGITVIWANARDTALGFYERLGWKVAGDGFLHGFRDMPHHVVIKELTTAP